MKNINGYLIVAIMLSVFRINFVFLDQVLFRNNFDLLSRGIILTILVFIWAYYFIKIFKLIWK